MLFNEEYMHKHLKIRSLILVALIVASFFTVTFLPTTTLAVDSTKSPNENARALGYFYTLRRCVGETFSTALTSLTEDRINNFSWLSGYKLPLGAQFISSNGDWDGNVNCDGGGEYGSWRQDAVRALGYSNNRQLLCNMMNPYQVLVDGDSSEASRSAVEAEYNKCVNGQGNLDVSSLVAAKNNSTISSLVNNSAGQKFFIDTTPISSMNVELPLQQLFYTTFQKFCQPTDYNGGTIGNDLRKVSIKRFDPESSTYKSVDVLVKADRINKTTDPIAHNVLPSGEPNKTLDSSTMSCEQIKDKANSYTDKAQAIYDSLPKETRDNISPSINGVNNSGGGDSSDKTTCTINGIGWILCPVMNFIGGITDASYHVVAMMLSINPSMFDQSKSEGVATFSAWSIMRNFANVAFVIVFLIIIFSQLTSFGVSNYGIKKMLPKLVVAAILVNVSYYLCAIAVDLSNILGSSTKLLFDSVSKGVVATNNATLLDKTFSGADGGNLFGILTGTIIATAAGASVALYAGLSILLPVLISALAAIVTVVLVLTLRQALIILLIVVSPLAFVALLLPNTEGLFKKWRSLLTTLLLMFPIIAGIFGASALAGKIVMSSDGNILVQVMGAGITIIPLFITPVVMKAAGGLLNRFGGIVNNPNRGPFDLMRKRAGAYRDMRQNERRSAALTGGSVFGGGQFRRETRRNYRNKASEDAAKAGDAAFSMTDSTTAGYANSSTQSQLAVSAVNAARSNATVAGIMAGTVNPGDALGNAAGIPEIAKALAEQQAKALSDSLSSSLKTLAQEVAKEKAAGNDTDAFLVARARNKSLPQIEQDAAIHQLATTGRDKAIRDLQGDATINQSTVQEAISAGAGSLIGKAPDLVKGAKAGFGDVTGEQLAGYSKSTAEAYIKHMEGLSAPDFATASARFDKAINDIKADSTLQAKFSGDTGLELIKTLGSSPRTAASIGGTASSNIDSVSGKIT
jgi:hypothetical protein